MANLNKKSKDLLLAIAAAMIVAPNYMLVTPADAKPLIDAKFAEQNPGITGDNGALATRLTDAGQKEATANGFDPSKVPAAAPATTAKQTFVIANVERPKVNRASDTGGSKYPFGDLAPGQAFFIPAPADMKSPSKSFGSLVSAANKRFNTATDFRRFTTRAMTGDVFDPDGSKGLKGLKGVGVFRNTADEETAAKAKAFPPAGQQPAT